MTSKRVPEPLF